MIGTSVCRIGKIRSKHILWEITEVWCKNTKNWFGLDIMYEFPDDDSFGIETRSNVESRLLNRVVSEWRVLPFFCANTITQMDDSEYGYKKRRPTHQYKGS